MIYGISPDNQGECVVILVFTDFFDNFYFDFAFNSWFKIHSQFLIV